MADQERIQINQEEQRDIELLKNKLRQSKKNPFQNTEEEVSSYIQSLKGNHAKDIKSILANHKDRMFACDLQVDPESQLGKKVLQHHTQSVHKSRKSQQRLSTEESQLLQSQQLEEPEQEQQSQKQNSSIGGKKKKDKERGAIWRAQNRDHADYESSFKDYLKVKQDEILNPPVVKVYQKYKPIIIKTNEKTDYEKGVDDSDIGSEYSELSDFAYQTAADIMQAYTRVFESQDKQQEIRHMRIKDFKDDEIFLLSQFYQQIKNKSCQAEMISKEELERSLLSHPYILQLYNINPTDLNKGIEDIDTKKQNLVSRQEMIDFLMNPTRPALKNFDPSVADALLRNRPVPVIKKDFILKEEDFKKITDVFLNLDTFGDHKISVKQLVHNLRRDKNTIPILPQPAIYIQSVRKCIPVDRLIFELEQEMYHAPSRQLRQEKSTITWDDFINFFQNYERRQIPTKDEIIKAQRLTGKFDSCDVLEVPKEFIKILKESFEECDKTADYFVRKYEFGEELRQHPQYSEFKKNLVRESEHNGQAVETIDRTVDRMAVEADEFIDLDEVIDFFTRKGRPTVIEKGFQERREQQRKNKALSQWNREEFSSPDEEDLKQKRKSRKVNKIKGIKEARKVKKAEDDIKNAEEMIKGKPFGAVNKDAEEGFEITVPVAYSFDRREKNRKEFIVERRLKESLAEKQAEEDKLVAIPGSFRANKIPKHVSDRHLLDKINKKQEKRREEVRKHSKVMTKLNENPFTFYYRDKGKAKHYHCFNPEDEEQQKYQHYQAKPAPWYTSVLMLERMYREQEEKTRTYVQKRMAELSQMSHLPQGVKNMMERLKEKDEEMKERQQQLPDDFTFQPPRAKPIPDFESLHLQFQELLDEKKQSKSKTIPREFNFQETRKAPTREYMDQENVLIKKMKEQPDTWGKREKKIKQLKNIAPKYMPPSTKKFEAMVEKRKREDELKSLETEDKFQREQDKENRREQFAKFVRSSGAIIDNTNQLEDARMTKIQQRRSEQINWEQQFDELMTNMMKRVIRRPLLVESQSQGNYGYDRVNRLKWLLGEGQSVEEQPEELETENYNEQMQQQQMQQQYQDQNQNQMYDQDQQQQYENQEQQQYDQQQYNEVEEQQMDQQQFEDDQQGQYDEQYEQQQQQYEEYQQNQYDDQQVNELNNLEQQQQGDDDQQQQDEDDQGQLNEEELMQQQQYQQDFEQEQQDLSPEEQQLQQEQLLLQQQQQEQQQQQFMDGQEQDDDDQPPVFMEGEQQEEGDYQPSDSDEERKQQLEIQRQQLLEQQQQQMENSDIDQDQFQGQQQEGEEGQYMQGEGEEGEEGEYMMDGELNFEDYTPEQKAQVIEMLRQQGFDINEEDFAAQEQYMEGEEEGEEGDDQEYEQQQEQGGQRQHSF